jgi:ABC-type multidrug transport system permease subunit
LLILIFSEAKYFCAEFFLLLFSGWKLHCMCLLKKAILKFAAFCYSQTLMQRRKTMGNWPAIIIVLFLFFLLLLLSLLFFIIILIPCLFFRGETPLHWSVCSNHLEVCRLLLQCNANVNAMDEM